jgi:hypothetical protein
MKVPPLHRRPQKANWENGGRTGRIVAMDHACCHPNIVDRPTPQQRREVMLSITALQQQLEHPNHELCHRTDEVTPLSVTALQQQLELVTCPQLP